MKKTILLLLYLAMLRLSYSQKQIPIEGPCSEEKAMMAKGSWNKDPIFDRGTFKSGEINSRIAEFHKLISATYPQPTGVSALWHQSAGISYFGSKVKMYTGSDGRFAYDFLNLPQFKQYYYESGFFRYLCGDGNFLQQSSETGTVFGIIANTGGGSVREDDTWTINGLPVITRSPVLKVVRGYAIHHPEPGSNTRSILIHRKGTLPYIPVTRKQYLDYCLKYYEKFYDSLIRGLDQMPVRSLPEQEKEKAARLAKYEKDLGNDPKRLKAAIDYYLASYQTDQQRRQDQVSKAHTNKLSELKRFSDELEKTTREGLLDSAAVIRVKYYSQPIFETDSQKGHMLVIENPEYIRKDLPVYVPQILVVYWRYNNWAPQEEIDKIIERDFPFEKLEGMIDR